jgi:hypothetical protein
MSARTIRDLADAHVAAHAELDPLLATSLGLPTGQDRLPDLSPAGEEALDALDRETLTRLEGVGEPECAGELSTFQASAGMISGNLEGWALYAERLMDELGFLIDPGERLGYLDAQMMRAIRVIIDNGMHLELTVPADSPRHAGLTWTPELARDFFGAYCGRDRLPRQRAAALPRRAGPGDQLQARRARVAGGTPRDGPGVRTSTSRPGTWPRSRRARWASTTWSRSWPPCSALRRRAPRPRRPGAASTRGS